MVSELNGARRVLPCLMLVLAVVLSGCGIGASTEAPDPPAVNHGPTSTPVGEPNSPPPDTGNITGPDLMIQDVSWAPRQPKPGDNVSFNVTVGYHGRNPVGPFTITYFINDVATGNALVLLLEPGESVTKTFRRRALNEKFIMRIEVDSEAVVEEIDENNNTGAVIFADAVFLAIGADNQPVDAPEPVVIPGPDLAVHRMSWSPLNPKTGDTVSFNVTIKNQGNQPAGSFTISHRVDGEQRNQSFVPGLAVNATANKTFSWRVLAIDYTISVVADSGGAVVESDETNNQHEVVFSETPFGPPATPTVATNISGKADLVIESVTYSPQVPLPGENVSFNVTIKNNGEADTGVYLVRYYINNHDFRDIAVPSLTATNSTVVGFDWHVKTGATDVLIIVDYTNTVIEQNESNNRLALTLSDVVHPDLAFNSVTLEPESPSVGDNVTLTVNVGNDGVRSVADFWVTIYLDDQKVRMLKVDGMAAGDNTSLSIIWPAEPGQNVLVAVIDELGEIKERNDNNNRMQMALPEVRLPDLSVDEILWSPLNPLVNESCVFSVTVRNAGPGDAQSSWLTFFIDEELKQSREIPSLAVGETWTTTYKWTAEVGEHDISATVDYGIAPEVSQQNNSLDVVFSHTVIPFPDLVVSALSLMPASPAAGDSVALHIEISNYGSLASSSSLLRCYIDDQLVTSFTVWTINAGQSSDQVYYFEAAPGIHNIRIVVDAMNRVIESREDNNSREMQFTVTG